MYMCAQKFSKKDLGIKGERIAQIYLLKKGYTILDINKRFGRFEIDIIAQMDDQVVFIEVKTRSTAYFGFPEEFVSDKQKNNFLQAADLYFAENKRLTVIRFDIIAIVIQKNITSLRHFQDTIISMT